MALFDYTSPVTKYTTLLLNLTILNLLWLLCSLPVFTMGASTAAVYTAANALSHDHIKILPCFFKAFKKHFRQATIIWMMFLVLASAFYMNYHLLTTAEVPAKALLITVSVLAFITLLFVMLWVYAVMTTFRGNIRELLFNAFVFSFMYAPLTLIAAGLYGIAGFLFIRFLAARVLCLVFGHALVVYCNLVFYRMAFKKYAKKGLSH